MKLGKSLGVVLALLVVVTLGIGARFGLERFDTHEEAQSVPIGGPFTLVDHTGKTVTEKDFEGRHMLISFGYTFCPDICPMTLQTMSEAMDMLGKDGEEVVPVFVTVDPERDTVEHLAQYVTAFHPRLIGLTGSVEQVKATTQTFRIYAAKAEVEGMSDYLMDHSALIYLIDPKGRYAAHFSHQNTAAEMAEGIKAKL